MVTPETSDKAVGVMQPTKEVAGSNQSLSAQQTGIDLSPQGPHHDGVAAHFSHAIRHLPGE